MKKNYLISTGGSGGHVIPATILFEHLSKVANIIITTDLRGLKYLDTKIYNYKIINTPKLNNIFLLPLNVILVSILTFKSYIFLKREKIQTVFSTGGYMSLPLFIASRLLKLKIYLIEPNQVLGRANKFFLKYCKKIFCYSYDIKNFPIDYKNKIIKIYPLVKKQIYEIKPFFSQQKKITLLIVGGSQGAKIFDENLKYSIAEISKKNKIKIIHQTNKKNIDSLSEFYSKIGVENQIFSFKKNFSTLLQQVDLCITRAGASTMAELSVANIPFIAVPLPSAKDNHQFENAIFYKNKDCCWIIDQKNFESKIYQFLKEIIENKINLSKKKENLKKLNYQNNWINVNQKIIDNINEN